MILPSNRIRITAATKPADFGRQHNGFVARPCGVSRGDPFTAPVFPFRSKRVDGSGIVCLDGLRFLFAAVGIGMDRNGVGNPNWPIILAGRNASLVGRYESAVIRGRTAASARTPKLTGAGSHARPKATLEATAAYHTNDRIDDLPPWNFAGPSS